MEKKKKSGWSLQLILFLLILAIIIFCAAKLIAWNNSGDIVLDYVEDGAYDYESLDIVFNVDPDILEEREDDGVNTILCIGNDFATRSPEGTSIAGMISGMENTELITLTAYSSLVADKVNAYNGLNKSYWQAANLYEIVYALCTGDYSLQKEALDKETNISPEFYDTLSAIDMDKIDSVFILYDSVDYRQRSILYDPDDKYNTSTYEGALRASITAIQTAYPHIRVIVGSPYLHGVVGDDTVDAATLVNYGNGNLSEYVMRQYNIAMECCVSYEDNFFGLITEETMNYYCNVYDLSGEGVEMIGNHIVEFLLKKY